jgi:DNA-binding NarL/FixJ family response regulator
VGAFEALLARFEANDSPLEAARTHACFAAAAERAGFDGIAGVQQRAALAAFERLGAVGWTRLARRQRQVEERGHHPAFDALTDTELAVLQLARSGARNREIATALFMSLRSVELRLTQIYRKFDAHSRAQLFALLPDSFPATNSDAVPPDRKVV